MQAAEFLAEILSTQRSLRVFRASFWLGIAVRKSNFELIEDYAVVVGLDRLVSITSTLADLGGNDFAKSRLDSVIIPLALLDRFGPLSQLCYCLGAGEIVDWSPFREVQLKPAFLERVIEIAFDHHRMEIVPHLLELLPKLLTDPILLAKLYEDELALDDDEFYKSIRRMFREPDFFRAAEPSVEYEAP